MKRWEIEGGYSWRSSLQDILQSSFNHISTRRQCFVQNLWLHWFSTNWFHLLNNRELADTIMVATNWKEYQMLFGKAKSQGCNWLRYHYVSDLGTERSPPSRLYDTQAHEIYLHLTTNTMRQSWSFIVVVICGKVHNETTLVFIDMNFYFVKAYISI